MAFTAREERRVKDALNELADAIETFAIALAPGNDLSDERIIDALNHLTEARTHIDAIRTTTPAARPRKEVADVLPG